MIFQLLFGLDATRNTATAEIPGHVGSHIDQKQLDYVENDAECLSTLTIYARQLLSQKRKIRSSPVEYIQRSAKYCFTGEDAFYAVTDVTNIE